MSIHLADVTGYGLSQAFYLEADETKYIAAFDCCIIYINVGGGGEVVEVFKRYSEIKINKIFNVSNYDINIGYTGVKQISVNNPTSERYYVRIKIVNLA